MRVEVAVLAGDGVGPEVTAQAVRILGAVTASHGHRFVFTDALIGGAAMDATGIPFPDATRALVERADAVLLGAVGGPQWNDSAATVRPEQGLLALRGAMGTYANLRPVYARTALLDAIPLKPEVVQGADLVFVRELTGGIYFGEKSRTGSGSGERASDLCSYTVAEVERVVKVAASVAAARRNRVISVDKANVLETSRLWRRTVTRAMHETWPGHVLEHMLVDTCAMRLVCNPRQFDVIVTANLFGDILTDEAAALAGSIGLLPSASLGDESAPGRRIGLYEPVHGSAPDIAGKGVANPVGAILSAALLLRWSLGLESEAAAVERAVDAALADGWRTPDLPAATRPACSCAVFGDQVLARLASVIPAPAPTVELLRG